MPVKKIDPELKIYKGLRVFLITTMLLMITFCVFMYFGVKELSDLHKFYSTNYVVKEFKTGLDINDYVQQALIDSRMEQIYNFYNKYTQNKEVTFWLINYALDYKVPLNRFFALCWHESGFNINALNKNNENGSKDYGLMQLNSYTFKDFIAKNGTSAIFDIKNNIKLSAQFLADKYSIYGNWTETFISYNAGTTIKVGNHTIKHFHSVLMKEQEIDKAFNQEFIELVYHDE